MARIRKLSNLTSIKDPKEFFRHGSQAIGAAVDTINGGLEFDSNLATSSVSVTFTTANSDTQVAHGLGRPPTGFMTSMPTAACNIFLGTRSADANVIYLQSTAPATVLLIFH
jgi:hypothetical protein